MMPVLNQADPQVLTSLHVAARFVLYLQRQNHVGSAIDTPLDARSLTCITYIRTSREFGYMPKYLLDAMVPLSSLPGRAHLLSANSTTYHEYHHRWVPECSPLQVRKLGVNLSHYFVNNCNI